MPQQSTETSETTYVRLRATDKREFVATVQRRFRVEARWLLGTRTVECAPPRAVLISGEELEPPRRRGEYRWAQEGVVLREVPD